MQAGSSQSAVAIVEARAPTAHATVDNAGARTQFPQPRSRGVLVNREH